jgi:hypothetical protein
VALHCLLLSVHIPLSQTGKQAGTHAREANVGNFIMQRGTHMAVVLVCLLCIAASPPRRPSPAAPELSIAAATMVRTSVFVPGRDWKEALFFFLKPDGFTPRMNRDAHITPRHVIVHACLR